MSTHPAVPAPASPAAAPHRRQRLPRPARLRPRRPPVPRWCRTRGPNKAWAGRPTLLEWAEHDAILARLAPTAPPKQRTRTPRPKDRPPKKRVTRGGPPGSRWVSRGGTHQARVGLAGSCGRGTHIQLNLGCFTGVEHGELAAALCARAVAAFKTRWHADPVTRQYKHPWVVMQELQALYPKKGWIRRGVLPTWVYRRPDGLYGARAEDANGNPVEVGPYRNPGNAFTAMAVRLGKKFMGLYREVNGEPVRDPETGRLVPNWLPE